MAKSALRDREQAEPDNDMLAMPGAAILLNTLDADDVEVIFVYPGLGQLLVDSVTRRDLPVVQAACLIFAGTFIILNLIADVVAIVSNPRLLHPK